MTKARGSGIPGVRGGNSLRGAGYGAQSLGDASRTKGRSRAKVKDADRDVDVPCWCERRIVRVPLSAVNAGKTASCGARKCYDPHP